MITLKGINRKWLVPIFFAFFQNHLTLYTLPHVISGKMIFQENPCPHVLWNMKLAKKYFIYVKKNLQKRVGKYRFPSFIGNRIKKYLNGLPDQGKETV